MGEEKRKQRIKGREWEKRGLNILYYENTIIRFPLQCYEHGSRPPMGNSVKSHSLFIE